MSYSEETSYDSLRHYGTPRHSGRYPWGSGKNPQRNRNWLTRENELKKQGLSEKQRAEAMGLSIEALRAKHSLYAYQQKQEQVDKVIRLREKGMSPKAISERTGIAEPTVRSWVNGHTDFKASKTIFIADKLEEKLREKPYLDVGEGVERQLNISEVQLVTALEALKERGYKVTTFKQPQPTNPMQKTTFKVLTEAGVSYKELMDNRDKIASPDGLYFTDYGSEARQAKPPTSIDSKRIMVRYAEDGGGEKDGVIEVRPGVEDLNLGGRTYAQVRISVDGTHYLKGIAHYGYDMPDGPDIIFNTSKHKGTPALGAKDNTVLKPVKDDPLNPFGSAFTQWDYVNSKGEKVQSPMNIVNDDSSLERWSNSLSSQFLSKQPVTLAKRQLGIDYYKRENELKDILSIPNPTVRRKLLETFSEECDSAAVHMKGAAMPRQGTFAILPIKSLSDNEVYAPRYDHGEEVALIRFPHQGTFEIPILKVNNRNEEAVAVITPRSEHAIGINSHVAARLSGADFDGDTVLVIPTRGQNIHSTPALEGLKDFDPKETYRKPSGVVKTGEDGFHTQNQMGRISNLVTDMTIKGAPIEDIVKAVKHAQVVIDAEKHNLDWKRSELDNDIAGLKLKWQGKVTGGASTLLSRRKKALTDVFEREEVPVYKLTEEERKAWEAGEKVFRETGRTYRKKKQITNVSEMTPEELERHNAGREVWREYGPLKKKPSKSTPYAVLELDDVSVLSSGTAIEAVYIDYVNKVKRLGNEARKELRATGRLAMSANAKQTYRAEVESLDAKLNIAALNAPLERQATVIAGSRIAEMKKNNPELGLKENKDKLSKISNKEMARARVAVGAKRHPIDITEQEWEAIEAGAISDNKLTQILRYADIDKVRKLATPKKTRGLSPSLKARAKSLQKSGYTQYEIADALGISVNTLIDELKKD